MCWLFLCSLGRLGRAFCGNAQTNGNNFVRMFFLLHVFLCRSLLLPFWGVFFFGQVALRCAHTENVSHEARPNMYYLDCVRFAIRMGLKAPQPRHSPLCECDVHDDVHSRHTGTSEWETSSSQRMGTAQRK